MGCNVFFGILNEILTRDILHTGITEMNGTLTKMHLNTLTFIEKIILGYGRIRSSVPYSI